MILQRIIPRVPIHSQPTSDTLSPEIGVKVHVGKLGKVRLIEQRLRLAKNLIRKRHAGTRRLPLCLLLPNSFDEPRRWRMCACRTSSCLCRLSRHPSLQAEVGHGEIKWLSCLFDELGVALEACLDLLPCFGGYVIMATASQLSKNIDEGIPLEVCADVPVEASKVVRAEDEIVVLEVF